MHCAPIAGGIRTTGTIGRCDGLAGRKPMLVFRLPGSFLFREALVRSRRIRHDGNPVMRWCVANCEVATDPAGNIKPVKPGGAAQGTRRIDGVVAAVTALSRLMVLPDRPASPYASRGVRTVG